MGKPSIKYITCIDAYVHIFIQSNEITSNCYNNKCQVIDCDFGTQSTIRAFKWWNKIVKCQSKFKHWLVLWRMGYPTECKDFPVKLLWTV